MKSLIELNNIEKEYQMTGGNVRALKDVSLNIEQGEYVSIVGKSGSGKSTLLYLLGLMITPTNGSYSYQEKDVFTLPDQERAHLRGQSFGFVFQSFHLMPQLTVLQNVLMGVRYCPSKLAEIKDRARQLIDRVGLGHRLRHRPMELSNGEMQRVAMARALLSNPDILLADEPTGNLDEKTADEIASLMESFNQEGRTVIVVTHNMDLARRATRMINLHDGRMTS